MTYLNNGISGSGITQPDGGTGVLGWLSSIWKVLNNGSFGGGGSSGLAPNAATDTSLQSILAAIKATVNLDGTVWYDPTTTPTTYYIRRESVNEGTGVLTVSWYTPAGVSASPTTGNLQAVSNSNNVASETVVYTATSSGTGYSNGDILIHTFGVDTTSVAPSLLYSFWLNAGPSTTGILSTAPTNGTYTSVTQAVSGTVTVGGNVSVTNNPVLGAGTNTIGSVLGTTAKVTVTPTITGSSGYSVGQQIGGLITFANTWRTSNSGTLQSIRLRANSIQTATLKLYLFSANPTSSTFADKSVPSVASADFQSAIGPFVLSAPDSGLGTATIWEIDGIAAAIVGSTQSMYGIIVVGSGSPTFASNNDLSASITVYQD